MKSRDACNMPPVGAGQTSTCPFKKMHNWTNPHRNKLFVMFVWIGSSCRPEPIRHGSWQCLTQPSSLGGGVACTVRCDRDSARGPGFDTLETYRCNLTAWSPPLPSPLLACVSEYIYTSYI